MGTVEEGKGLLENAPYSPNPRFNRVFHGDHHRIRNYNTSVDRRKYSSDFILNEQKKKHVSPIFFFFPILTC